METRGPSTSYKGF